MSDVATTVQEPVQSTTEQNTPVQQDVNQIIANSLWGATPTVVDSTQSTTVDPASQSQKPASTEPVQTDDITYVDAAEYFQTNFGIDADTIKAKLAALNQYESNPAPTAPDLQFANDESKRIFDLIKEGKSDDVYAYMNQQRQIAKLEGYDVNNVAQASEIIKANLQFKYKDLSSQEIDRLFSRQYTMPEKPQQGFDQSDEDYQTSLASWQKQVQDKEQDLMIDAKLAKPELLQHKSQITLPDIPQANQAQQGPTQEDLDRQKAVRDNYLQAVNGSYQNFKGFNITANDGDVQLPVQYLISPEELAASKQMVEDFDTIGFFDNRWFSDGKPNINLIQEDLYLLQNRDKIFQKIANEASAQRFLHQQKIQNNIKLNGVSNEMNPSQEPVKDVNQEAAKAIWAL